MQRSLFVKVLVYHCTRHIYRAGEALFTALSLPLSAGISQAPYLGLRLALNPNTLKCYLKPHFEAIDAPLYHFRPDASLLDAIARLIASLDTPEMLADLAPLIENEIALRLCHSPVAPIIAHYLGSEKGDKLHAVLDYIQTHYREKIRTETLANLAHMSLSGLREHFRRLIGISPLQYQKQLRLNNARKLLESGMSAAQAAYEVGYESPQQFSREYRRYYGLPPKSSLSA
ncbi:AraC family transcriptional regulator [Suttonella ornithocola]|uniref:L-rhamnose operon regulatory protein rhaS n=1 Tax=Suttonella ornithocola TaxID=279832 RepID=A0A380MPJ0_9GAMM|nr:AraC family transcriptional regulator [Suttonella ornithocola]SUO94198.1 L-rhamnose operon regulatory protein rhaS [Suttonella ornithocola]